MKKYQLLVLILCLAGSLGAAPKHSKTTKYPSYKGLVMAGYQGWFHQPQKGVAYPDEKSVRLDMWPDVSEYEKTYPTGLKLADGSGARFFSSTDKSTTDLHFKWMEEYGVDGVFMQRFFGAARPESRRRSVVLQNGIGYVPSVCPGFSWHNLSRYEFPDDVKPSGSIPRQGGRFYWQQISTAINAGATMLYMAMFDEVNEGTAIFKCTDNPPVGKEIQFVGMDGMPSDHYLWLTGEAARMLRKEKPLSFEMPRRDK